MLNKGFIALFSKFIYFFLLLVSILFLAFFIKPQYFHFGGGDPGHYSNLSAKIAYGDHSSFNFYPSGLSENKIAYYDSIFTDERGLLKKKNYIGYMTNFIAVDKNHKIIYPHSHLYSLIDSFFLKNFLNGYLNYILLFFSSIILFLLTNFFIKNQLLSFLASMALISQASVIYLARYQMTEILSLFFILSLFYLSIVHKKTIFILCFVLLLSFTRFEFVIFLSFYFLYFTIYKKKSFSERAILLLTFIFNFIYYKIENQLHYESFFVKSIYITSAIIFIISIFFRNYNANIKIFFQYVSFLVKKFFVFVIAIFLLIILFGNFYLQPKFQASYNSLYLLVKNLNILFILGLIGFFVFRKNEKKLPKLSIIISLYLLIPIIFLASTNSNEFWGSRRFIPFVNIFFIFLAFYFLNFLEIKMKKYIFITVLLLTISTYVTFQISNWLFLFSTDKYTKDNVNNLHIKISSNIDKNSVIFLSRKNMIIQPTFRNWHNIYSFVLWKNIDDDEMKNLINDFKNIKKDVFVDQLLLNKDTNDVNIDLKYGDSTKMKQLKISRAD